MCHHVLCRLMSNPEEPISGSETSPRGLVTQDLFGEKHGAIELLKMFNSFVTGRFCPKISNQLSH